MLQATALLGRAQLCASLGDAAAAEAALAEAASVLDDMPAESAQRLRTHHWLLAMMLQLWMGETLALQQAGEQLCRSCHYSSHVSAHDNVSLHRQHGGDCTRKLADRIEDLESFLRGLGEGCAHPFVRVYTCSAGR